MTVTTSLHQKCSRVCCRLCRCSLAKEVCVRGTHSRRGLRSVHGWHGQIFGLWLLFMQEQSTNFLQWWLKQRLHEWLLDVRKSLSSAALACGCCHCWIGFFGGKCWFFDERRESRCQESCGNHKCSGAIKNALQAPLCRSSHFCTGSSCLEKKCALCTMCCRVSPLFHLAQ